MRITAAEYKVITLTIKKQYDNNYEVKKDKARAKKIQNYDFIKFHKRE